MLRLAAYWKLDLQQHPTVYQQLADQLGETHPMAKLIEKELAKEGEEPASTIGASSAFTSFWKDTAKSFQKALGDVKHAEKLTDDHKKEAEATWQDEAWPTAAAAASSTDDASGRVDGTVGSLHSGEGNVPLHLKLELAHHLGSFNP